VVVVTATVADVGEGSDARAAPPSVQPVRSDAIDKTKTTIDGAAALEAWVDITSGKSSDRSRG
jgi:hypothetical protein